MVARGGSSHWPPQHTMELDALLDEEVLSELRMGDESLSPTRRVAYAHCSEFRRAAAFRLQWKLELGTVCCAPTSIVYVRIHAS